MLTLDKEVLPKEVSHSDVGRMIGEHLYWFCTTCRKWRTTLVKPDVVMACPTCGNRPDWKKHRPMLSYKSRFKRVVEICAEDSQWRKECDEIESRYGDFLDQTYAGMPAQTKKIGWLYFSRAWKEIERVADYLLLAQDAPRLQIPYAYDEDGLQRRYYDSDRTHNVISLSNMNLPRTTDDGNVRYSDEEAAEVLSLRSGHTQPCYDTYFSHDIFDAIGDPLEKAIAVDLYRGLKKKEIERKYQLTERRVRTVISHIAKSLKNI